MAQKLSLKLLKTTVADTNGITYEALVEKLDAGGVTYNEPMLQGVILESLDKGNFIITDGDREEIAKATFGPKPRQSTGGGTPTRMYKLKNGNKPDAEKTDFQEKPYDKEFLESDEDGELWATTQLGAVKAAKSHFYRTFYWPALEQFRLMEESLAPVKEADEEEAA